MNSVPIVQVVQPLRSVQVVSDGLYDGELPRFENSRHVERLLSEKRLSPIQSLRQMQDDLDISINPTTGVRFEDV